MQLLALIPALLLSFIHESYGGHNLALGRPTRQSSTGWGGHSSRAVDGNRNSRYGGKSCTHTNRNKRSWWMVDLGKEYKVDSVAITNRGDCCGRRLRRFNIYVGDDMNSGGLGNKLCVEEQSIPQGRTKTFRCRSGAVGRYVFVRLQRRDFLTLCEVEVYGNAVSQSQGNTNLALGRPTRQSSTGWGGLSSRAVDGDHNPRYGGRSCTHTKRNKRSWWMVDLGKEYKVNSVVITNRGDCCGRRLRRFNIYVGDNTNNGGLGNRLCVALQSIQQGRTKTFHCRKGAVGRYVFVRLQRRDFLTLCEVEVYGNAVTVKPVAPILPVDPGTALASRIRNYIYPLLKPPKQHNIIILMDSAGSAGERNHFSLLKQFIVTFIQNMPANNGNHFTVSTTSGEDEFMSALPRDNAISTLKKMRFQGRRDLSYTTSMICNGYTDMVDGSLPTYVFSFVRGKDTLFDNNYIEQVSQEISSSSIKFLTIAISITDDSWLKKLTSKPLSSNYFSIPSYDILKKVMGILIGSTVPTPSPTKPSPTKPSPTQPPPTTSKPEGGSTLGYDKCNRRCTKANGKLVDCYRVRKDITSMTGPERVRYINAYKKISTEQPHKAEYDRLIQMHASLFSTTIHQRDAFLPWHRWYILALENLLRKVDCKVTVPYWDWSAYSQDPWSTKHLWKSTPEGFGGNGVPPNYCVQDGPFAADKWQVTPSAQRNGLTCLRRSFNGRTPDIPAIEILLKTPASQPTTFEESLRVNFHDRVHCNFGGDNGHMCTSISAAAPEFFLHHTFIDKIWSDWQKKSSSHKHAYFSTLTSTMRGTPYSASQVYDLLKQPGDVKVTYDDPKHDRVNKVIRKLEGMSVKKLENLPREGFSPINKKVFTLFHVSNKERAMTRKFERKINPIHRIAKKAVHGLGKVLGFNV